MMEQLSSPNRYPPGTSDKIVFPIYPAVTPAAGPLFCLAPQLHTVVSSRHTKQR